MFTAHIDPVFGFFARVSIAALFAVAVLHKLQNPRLFVAQLENYRLLPHALLTPAALLLCLTELFVVGGTLANFSLASLTAAVLLSLYTGAMIINLWRGRRDIDCGCAGPAASQALNNWLPVRNLVLILVSLIALAPSAQRPLIWIDFATIAAASATLLLLYQAGNQLASNSSQHRAQGS